MNMKIPYAHHHNEYSPPKIYPNKITNVTLDTDVRLKYANGQANQNHNIFTSPKHYENKASDLANFTISKLSPPPQRKTFAVGQNKYILTPKQGHRETSPTLRNNGQANKFELPKNQFKKQLQSNNENVKINKKREDSVKSGQHQTKKVQNKQIPKTVSNQQQLKKYQIIPACFNQAINNIKIVQQKINMQKVLNKSIRKKSNYLSPNIKRGQSPDSLSLKDDFNDEVRSIQGRKQSQKIYNLPKESNKPTNFIKLQTEIAPSRSLKQQSLMKQTRKQVKQRSPSKDKVIKKKQPKYSYKLSETNIQKCKQPKISTASSGGEAPHLEDFPVKQKAPHKLSYQISQPNDIMQIKGKTSFQKKTETHENLNEVNQNKSSQFIFGKVIGTGKFGQVYQAKHKKTGFLVALKKIYKQKIKQYNLQKQLVEEIRLQAYTSHPNIVNMYGIFSDAHHIYLILEYMEGGTLFDFLSEKQKLPPKQVSLIMKEISLAVKYLHKNQIAHRDIKPENILFSHGVAKLCDFGWSARVIDKRKTYCGTFDYVPPEMLQRKQYDQSVDLWCLGVLMYQLLTGKVPFEHKQRTVLMNRIINVDKQKIQYPDHVCQQAIQVIQHLIRKNPNERTKTQQLLEYKFFKMKFQ